MSRVHNHIILLVVTLTCQHLLSTPTSYSEFRSNEPRRTTKSVNTDKTTESKKGELSLEYRRQDIPPEYANIPPEDLAKLNNTTPGNPYMTEGGADAAAKRFTIPKRVQTERTRTLPYRGTVNFSNCEYYAMHCLKAYNTGKVCGRTMYYRYYQFQNYCMLDYVNCLEKFEMWQILNMGECFVATFLGKEDYQHYAYYDENFMDQYYVLELDQVYG